eukprot:Skav219105  [mRNA]  locus=scaffold1574:221301:235951:- [translate_table: standard]
MKDRELMLRLALDKAARSWDPDLMYSAISAACSGDPCERGSDIQSCARLIKEKLYDLQVVGQGRPGGDMVTKQLMAGEQFDRARTLNDLLDRKRLSAFAALHRVFRQQNYDERNRRVGRGMGHGCKPWQLPTDVDWVISMDLGDVVVMDDISQLWGLRHQLQQQFLGVSYAAALGQHLNAGLVLYNLRRMRQGNFTELTLRAAMWSKTGQGDGTCPRDQNILNVLNDEEFLDALSVEKAKVMRILPCRWSLFPAVDWHPAWSKPELWHTELFHRLRYPGLVCEILWPGTTLGIGHVSWVSDCQVELYCPDSVDLLMAFAFLPISSHQSRVRIYAEQEGGEHLRHCHPLRIGQPCCRCGEAAALLHVAGDLKQWPAMRNFLDQGRLEHEDVASERWWGGDLRQRTLEDQSAEQMFLMAKAKGLDLVIPLSGSLCRTMRTEAGAARDSGLGQLWSKELEVQTTAEEFRLRLTWNSSLEVTMEAQLLQVLQEGTVIQKVACAARPTWISLRFLGFGTRSLQLEVCGDKMDLPGVAGSYFLQVASLQEALWAICVT